MFETLRAQAEDRILGLMAKFRADPRAGKIDLGVGVYRDAEGHTPIMTAVRKAEIRLAEAEPSKTYTAQAGDPGFHAAMAGLVFGPAFPAERLAAAATPGGTGALRQALELIRLARPAARVWLPDPTWPNHLALIDHVGLARASYRYFDAATQAVDGEGLLADLGRVAAGDVVLLHGCCHNPTGADPSPVLWRDIGAVLARRGALPLIDLAYQGFGAGLEADAAPLRAMAAAVPEMLVAASASKNFGVYRDRVGVLFALGEARERTQGALVMLNRVNFSFPPDHGARLVGTVLGDPVLRAEWQAELDRMRKAIIGLRAALADELRRLTGSDRFGFLNAHRGMFSRLGLSEAQVNRLRDEHAIYMVGDSRINVAGLNAATVPVLAAAILKVAG